MLRRDFLKHAGLSAAATLTLPAFATMLASPAQAASRAPNVVFIGDSLFAACNDAAVQPAGDYLSFNAHGEIVWAWMQDPRFQLNVWVNPAGRPTASGRKDDGANQGIVGSVSYRLNSADEVAHVRSLKPDVVIIGFGANDIPRGISLEDYQRAVVGFCDIMVADGAKIIVATVRPHVTGGSGQPIYDYPKGDAKWDTHFIYNDWITGQLPGLFPGKLWVWDTFTPLLKANGYRGAEMMDSVHRDGVHLNELGAYRSSTTLLPIIREIMPAGTFFNADPTVDNLLPNPTLSGSGGVAGPGVSGAVPDGCAITRRGGVSGDILADNDGPLRLTLGARRDGAGLDTVRLALHQGRDLVVGGLGGRGVQLMVPFSAPSSDRLKSISVTVTDTGAGANRVDGLRSMDRKKPLWPNAPVEGWLISPVLQLPDGASGLRASVTIVADEGDENLTVTLGAGAILRVV